MKLSPLWSGVTVAVAILLTVLLFDAQSQQRLAVGQRAEVAQELHLLRARIEALLDKYRYLGTGLGAYLTTYPAVDPQDFAAVLRSLSRDDTVLRGVVVLHEGEPLHAFVAPPQPHQSSAPLRLVVPVPAQEDGRRPWGQIEIDLDRGALLARAGLSVAADRPLLAVRGNDGRLLAGAPAVFAAAQAELQVAMPDGHWTLAGYSRAPAEMQPWAWVFGVLCALVGGVATWQLRHAQITTRRLALHDCLTGLPNRRLLQDRVQQACAAAARSQRQIVLMYLDLDNFKPVNDNYGHHAGDEVLREVAQRLRHCVRRSDTVARVSGDEFVLMLDDLAEIAEAETVADKVLAIFARPIVVGEHAFVLGCSIGLVAMEAGCDVDQALVRADSAMYQAKRDGKNSYRWYVSEPEQLKLEVAAETAV